MVMQLAKSTLAQLLSTGGRMITNIGPTEGLDSKIVFATEIFDWMIKPTRVKRQ
jgi:hypothetical protein